MFRFQFLYAFVFLFFFASSGFSQIKPNGDAEWTRIKDDKSDFSISFPSNFLVDNELEKSFILAPILASLPDVIDSYEKPRITATRKSVMMTLGVFQLRRVSSAKNYLWHFAGGDTAENYQDFQVGDFVGRKKVFDTEKRLAMNIAVAEKSRVFLIKISAKPEDRKIYEEFITSLTLNGKPLFKDQTPELSGAAQTVLLSTLPTSPEILETLNRKQDKSKFEVVKGTIAASEEKEKKDEQDEQNYSRPLIFLRSGHPKLGSVAGRGGISGIVRLKVTFLADGNIGRIVVFSELPKDVTESAVKAAQKIKFLPAEMDGKKVDVTKTVEYAFDIQ